MSDQLRRIKNSPSVFKENVFQVIFMIHAQQMNRVSLFSSKIKLYIFKMKMNKWKSVFFFEYKMTLQKKSVPGPSTAWGPPGTTTTALRLPTYPWG